MHTFAVIMKKILLSVIVLMCVVALNAVPSHPGTAQVRQPDGTYITLRLLGDEWRSFNTTADGYSVVRDSRGYYVYAEQKDGKLLPTARVAHDASKRSASEQAFLAGVKKYQMPQMTAASAAMKARVESVGSQRRAQSRAAQYDYSKFKGLIILVQFNDKEFSRPDYKDIITDMVNKQNYTGYDKQAMPGSVRDYFSDNSDGKFQPQFDVVGPYTVDFSQYDCNMNDGKCAEVLKAAVDSADVDVNFKDYDGDSNGRVDLVFFVIAGNGANYSGNSENLWWPHRSIIYNPNSDDWRIRKDGVLLYDYASSTELAGYTSEPKSNYIDGIGTICHEFSHVLGLPDFYDTNYDEDGSSVTPGVWSLMDQGCYLNGGYTPVGYSLYERYSVGFADEPKKITGAGSIALNPLHTSNTGLRIDSQDKNEFFLLENRQNGDFKWDAYLPAHGMLVHRVDLSSNRVWQENTVNADLSHNYYQVLRAGGDSNANTNYDLFPGRANVQTLHNGTDPANLMTWSGKATQWGLFNIREEQGLIKFDVQDALTLTALSLPETAEVGVSVTLQMAAALVPEYAVTTLQWSSSNTDIATIDDDGVVTGVSEGTCVITVTSDNGLTASSQLTVKQIPLYDIAAFKALYLDSQQFLQLKQAQVLYASGSTAFVRDASGAIMLVGLDDLKTNDVIDGAILVQVGQKNQLPQALLTANTLLSGLTITEGSEPQLRDVALESLTTADYCDLVLVKAAKLVSKKVDGKSGVYLESGDRSIRFFNSLKNLGFSKTVTMPKNYVNKYYDVPALYATYADGTNAIEALYLMDSLTEVEEPTGIVELRQSASSDNAPAYNLQGQHVSRGYKGLVIKNGRKAFVK